MGDGGRANSFTMGGAKGDDVRFSCSWVFGAPTSGPTAISTGGYSSGVSYGAPGFIGTPIRFQHCRFWRNGASYPGLQSWDLTFSNNASPDMSLGGTSQTVLPVACDAGMMTCSAQFTFQSTQTTDHLATGDNFWIDVPVAIAAGGEVGSS
jgi:hypothetical protein